MSVKPGRVSGKTGVRSPRGLALLFIVFLLVFSGFSTMVNPVSANADSLDTSTLTSTDGLSVMSPDVLGATDLSDASSDFTLGSPGLLHAGGYVYVGRLEVGMDGVRQCNLSMFNRESNTFVRDIPLASIPADKKYARVVYAVSPDGARVYAACTGGRIVEINTSTGGYMRDIVDENVDYPFDLAVSPDGRSLYIVDYSYYKGGSDGRYSLFVMDLEKFSIVSHMDESHCPGFSFNLTGSSWNHFMAAGQDHVYLADDTGTYRAVRDVNVSDLPERLMVSQSWYAEWKDYAGLLLLSPDGKTLVEGCGPYGFDVRDLVTGNIVKTLPFNNSLGGDDVVVFQPSMTFSPTGDRLYVGVVTNLDSTNTTTPGAILEYDTTDYSLTHTYMDVCSQPYPVGGALALGVSPDGNTLFYTDNANNDSSVNGVFVALDRTTGSKTSLSVNGIITQILPNPKGVFWQGKYAYVALENEGAVAMIDTVSSQVVYKLKVDGRPKSVATSLDGTRLYVSDGMESILVYDTCYLDRIATINVGIFPYDMVLNYNGTRLYVSNYGSNTTSVIDTRTNTVLKNIPVGGYPCKMAITPSGKFLYVANQGSDNVMIIDTWNGTVIRTISSGFHPYGVYLNPLGTELYVTYNGPSILVYDCSNYCIIENINVAMEPYSMVFTPDGSKAYVSVFDYMTTSENANAKIRPEDVNYGSVYVLDVYTHSVLKQFNNVGFEPMCPSIDPTGRFIYVADKSDSIYIINTTTDIVDGSINLGNNSMPVGTVFNPRGTFTNPVASMIYPNCDGVEPLVCTVMIEFDRLMDNSAIGGGLTVKKATGEKVEGMIQYFETVVEFIPNGGLEANTSYIVELPGNITDYHGNPLGKDYTWTFKTGADTLNGVIPPKLNSQLVSPNEVILNQADFERFVGRNNNYFRFLASNYGYESARETFRQEYIKDGNNKPNQGTGSQNTSVAEAPQNSKNLASDVNLWSFVYHDKNLDQFYSEFHPNQINIIIVGKTRREIFNDFTGSNVKYVVSPLTLDEYSMLGTDINQMSWVESMNFYMHVASGSYHQMIKGAPTNAITNQYHDVIMDGYYSNAWGKNWCYINAHYEYCDWNNHTHYIHGHGVDQGREQFIGDFKKIYDDKHVGYSIEEINLNNANQGTNDCSWYFNGTSYIIRFT